MSPASSSKHPKNTRHGAPSDHAESTYLILQEECINNHGSTWRDAEPTSGILYIVISCARGPSQNTNHSERETAHLLLKIPPVLLVNEDQVEVVARAKLFVHFAEGGRQLKAAKE